MLIRRLKNDLLNEKTVRFDAERKGRTLRKGTTVNRYLQLLSKILEMTFEEGLIDVNPMRRVPLEPEGEGRERYLTSDEEAHLLSQLTGRLAHLYAPVVVDIDTGMRVNRELLSLQVEHCNFGSSLMSSTSMAETSKCSPITCSWSRARTEGRVPFR
jgi:site-specific recombinase XerD